MNPSVRLLSEIAAKTEKRIIGLMSGTSLDGLDIALCRINGQGKDTKVELERFQTIAYTDEVRSRLKRIVSINEVAAERLCLAHSWLADLHADMVLDSLHRWKMEPKSIDCIASHGQTVYHAPIIGHQQHGMPNATLQIGDGDHIARKTGILTISDFRQKHTAVGGEGAPMVVFAEQLLYTDSHTDRLLLNIGGIANATLLPASTSGTEVRSTDIGPGNTLINAAMQRYFDQPFDKEGAVAQSGTVNAVLFKELYAHAFFKKELPKTTGPESFNLEWVERCQEATETQHIEPADLVATLTWLTAQSIADTIKDWRDDRPFILYLSGGGMHNKQLIRWMKNLSEGIELHSFEELGLNPDAKEAVCFAVLANETLSGEGFLFSPNGKTQRRLNFGKISLPV